MRVYGDETRSTSRELDAGATSTDRLIQKSRGLETQTRRTRIEFGALGQTLKLLKLPAIIASVGGLVQVMGALTGGAIELLPKMLDLAGAGAGWASVMVGAGAAMGVAKLATSGLSQALQGNRKALADLTPQGRAFVSVLKSMHPEVQKLRSSAQAGLFPGVGDLLSSLKSQAPQLKAIVSQTAGDLGGLARFAGKQIAAPGAMKDLASVAAQGGRSFGDAGRGAIYLGKALEQVLLAAQPLTDWLGTMFVREAKLVDEHAILGRATGSLGAYFDRTKSSIQTMGDIGKNVFDGLRGLMQAATGDSNSLWGSIDKAARRFDAWSNSFAGQDSMRTWFDQLRPTLSETVGLFGDLGKAIGSLTTGPQGAEMIKSLRDALPSLTSGLQSLTASLGPAVVSAFGSVVHLLGDMAGQAGPLVLLARSVGTVANAVDQLLKVLGPLGPAVATAFGAYGLAKKMKVFDALDGLRAKWSGVGASAAGAATEERAAATAGTGGVLAAAGGARGVMAAETVAGGALAGRAMAGGGTMLPSGVILPAGVRAAETTAEETAGPGLLSRGLGAAGGLAGRFLLPLTAIQGLFGAIGTQGNLGQRLEGGLSAATFGLIPAPVSKAQRVQQGTAAAQGVVAGLGPGGSLASQKRAIANLRGHIASTQDWRSQVPGDFQGAVGSQLSPAIKADTKGLQQELKRREGILHQSQMEVDRSLAEESIRHAQALTTDFVNAFGILKRAKGPEDAMQETVTNVIGRMKTLRPAGQKVLGDSMLAWVHEQEQQNPKLKGQYDRLIDDIKSKFTGLGKHVQVVNDTIYTGSTAEWKKIAAALMNPTEQAKEQVSANFTQIQREALGSLTAMGFTSTQAMQIVQGHSTQLVPGASVVSGAAASASGSSGKKRATGGRTGAYRLPGSGTLDTVLMADGGYGAPGELVLNRWTERDVDHDLSQAGKPLLDQRVRRETRKHSDHRSSGGRVAGIGSVASQHPELHAGIAAAVQTVLNRFPLTITSTTGGGHVANSYHYLGEAADIAGDTGTMFKAADWIRHNIAGGLTEGIHNPNLAVKYGQVETPPGVFGAVWAEHANHIHMAVAGAFKAGQLAAGVGAAGGAAAEMKALRAPGSSLGGVPGALVNRAGQMYAAALTKKINENLGVAGGGGGGGQYTIGNVGNLQSLDHVFAANGGATFSPSLIARIANWAGLPGQTFAEIAHGESDYQPGAVEAPEASGAQGFGLFQITTGVGNDAMIAKFGGSQQMLNPLKNAKAAKILFDAAGGIGPWHGTRYVTNAATGKRLDWGGWNAAGADMTVNRPTVFGAGEAGPERVRITPAGRGGGGITIQRGAVQVNAAGRDERAVERYVDMRLRKFAEEVAAEIEAGAEEPSRGAMV
jgi:hypothetical protein